MHKCVHAWAPVNTGMCAHVLSCKCACVRATVCMCACVCVCLPACARTHAYMCDCARVREQADACKHACARDACVARTCLIRMPHVRTCLPSGPCLGMRTCAHTLACVCACVSA